jgi:hypothetical protein
MRWTRAVQLTSAPDADGKVVWFWHPDADAKPADDDRPVTETTKPVSGKSAKETVKTSRVRECRVNLARPW